VPDPQREFEVVTGSAGGDAMVATAATLLLEQVPLFADA
jgi:hypothetical protein